MHGDRQPRVSEILVKFSTDRGLILLFLVSRRITDPILVSRLSTDHGRRETARKGRQERVVDAAVREVAGPSGGANWELSDAHLLAIAEKVALKLLAARETEEPVSERRKVRGRSGVMSFSYTAKTEV